MDEYGFPDIQFRPPQNQIKLVTEVDNATPDGNGTNCDDLIPGRVQARGFKVKNNQAAIGEQLLPR